MEFDEHTKKTVTNLITCNVRIMSGTSVFKNTRVPIKNLIDYLEAGDNLDEFLEDFLLSVVNRLCRLWSWQRRCCSRKPMRILIDECLPKKLKQELRNH